MAKIIIQDFNVGDLVCLMEYKLTQQDKLDSLLLQSDSGIHGPSGLLDSRMNPDLQSHPPSLQNRSQSLFFRCSGVSPQ